MMDRANLCVTRPAGSWSALSLCVFLATAALSVNPAWANETPAPTAGKSALSVQLVGPQLSSWPSTVSAVGNVAAWQEVVIGAETGGLLVSEVRAQVGDVVKRGQVLARLQDLGVQADLAQAEAALAEARAADGLAQADAQRARQLQAEGSGALSEQALQQYFAQAQSSAARLLSAQARVKSEQLRLQQTRIVAPDDGIISARTVTEGALAQAGQELFKLIRRQRLEWRAELPADSLNQIRPGMKAQILLPGRAQPLSAQVRALAPSVDPQTRLGLVFVDLPAGSGLRAGGFARGSFELGSSEALHVPQSAVLLRDGFAYVFKVNGKDSRVLQVKVMVGRRQGDRVELLAGLDRQTQIVASGVGFLADGDRVQVVSGSAAAATAGKP